MVTHISLKALVSILMNPEQLMKTWGPMEHCVTS